MKILILGSTGMLGHIVSYHFSKSDDYLVYNLSRRSNNQENSIQCDIKDLKKLENIINDLKPKVIINCIGLLIGDTKKSIENAKYINSFFPNYLVDLSKKYNYKVIHISTDCVFSGAKGSYNEYSISDAKDGYGITKSKGEFDSSEHLTIRTSIIGPDIKKNGTGLFQWIMNQNGSVKGFTNVKWSGVTTIELAKAIEFSILKSVGGIWNLTNEKNISKYKLLNIIIKVFNISNVNLVKESSYTSDKSLISIRNINYQVPSYNKMINDLKEYYDSNPDLY
jgi:dTDP-4-dehydrorhamnose reductase